MAKSPRSDEDDDDVVSDPKKVDKSVAKAKEEPDLNQPYPTGAAPVETPEEQFARIHPQEAARQAREKEAAKAAEKEAKSAPKK